ncbi:MAG: chemotaxis protein CheA [Desulfobacterales bacterium]|nr:chemotaxis protein CheA [Desulfobacterales bacterium]
MNESYFDAETITQFLDEAGKSIYAMNQNMLLIEGGNVSEHLINEMFREAHTIKGVAGMLNFTSIAEVTHSIETVFDEIRQGNLSFSTQVIEGIFQALDILNVLLADIATGSMGETDISNILENLKHLSNIKDQSNPQNLEKQLGTIPEFLTGKLDEEDIFQCLCAKNTGKHIYILRLSLNFILREYKDLIKFYFDLQSIVDIQTVIPVLNEITSPWEPLDHYDYRIAIVCFTRSTIRDALKSLEMIKCEAWEICIGDNLEPSVIIEITPPLYVDEKNPLLIVKSGMGKHLATFMSETKEELDRIDISILSWEENPNNETHVRELFQLMHRLKSSCASMGFDEMSRITHNCESILALFRDNFSKTDKDIFQLLYQTKDYLTECIKRIEAQETSSPDSHSLDEKIMAYLQVKGDPDKKQEVVFDSSEQHLIEEAAKSGKTVWKVTVKLFPETPMADLRYSMILRNLEQYVVILTSHPTIEELETGMEKVPVLSALISGKTDNETLNSLVNVDMVERTRIEKVAEPTGSSDVIEMKPKDKTGVSTVKTASGDVHSATVKTDTIRVDTERIDNIMNMAGELAVTKARISQLVEIVASHLQKVDTVGLESLIWIARQSHENTDNSVEGNKVMSIDRLRKLDSWIKQLKTLQETAYELKDASLALHRHTSMVQNTVMQMRMVPIGPLFQKFARLVRDLCKDKTKNAKLIISGENTELDKKLVDELADPLTHLIRNAVDHGLETEKDRVASGKSEQGSIFLSAFHEGGQICIQVKDDGRGLDMNRLKQKALSKGIINQITADRMSDQEVVQLIFLPGFSTAEQVTNISGRGVGMDIVKNKVTELKGKIDIDSKLGKGVCFNIRLPLTLAIIKSLLVEIGGTRYAFPLESVKEIVEKETREIKHIENKGRVVFLREDVIALIDLAHTIGIEPLQTKETTMIKAVMIRSAGQIVAIPVDRIIGEEEIVVKALPDHFVHVKGISGATILGDGGLALILDVDAILEMTKKLRIKN